MPVLVGIKICLSASFLLTGVEVVVVIVDAVVDGRGVAVVVGGGVDVTVVAGLAAAAAKANLAELFSSDFCCISSIRKRSKRSLLRPSISWCLLDDGGGV